MKLGNLFHALIQTVTLPLDIVKDVYTIGGIATDKSKSYTATKLDDIKESLNEITD